MTRAEALSKLRQTRRLTTGMLPFEAFLAPRAGSVPDAFIAAMDAATAAHQALATAIRRELLGVRSRTAIADRIASAKPRTYRELSAIRGIGPMALADHGEAILALVREHADATC